MKSKDGFEQCDKKERGHNSKRSSGLGKHDTSTSGLLVLTSSIFWSVSSVEKCSSELTSTENEGNLNLKFFSTMESKWHQSTTMITFGM